MIMKKTIVTIACCALIAPLAIAKEKKTKIFRIGYVEQGVTVSGTAVPTVVGGAAANYQPAGTLVVNHDGPGRYILNGRGNVLNSKGEVVRGAIKPGTPVRVYFETTAGVKTVDHVVVD
jgi:hypothetical protein